MLACSLFAFPFASAQLGCCSNPSVGASSVCLDSPLLQQTVCCPDPAQSPEAYQSPENPLAPLNQDECINGAADGTKFFDLECSALDYCQVTGCCCGPFGGDDVVSQASCSGTDLEFIEGATDCAVECPVPQCSDGIDNDGDGCADMVDTGCSDETDPDETGGICLGSSQGCNNQLHIPYLEPFEILAAPGKRELQLSWSDECSQNAQFYEIFRCQGTNCSNFAFLGTTTNQFFTDNTNDLLFGADYTYQLKAVYSFQVNPSIAVQIGNLGDLECFGQTTQDVFCVQPSTYLPHKDYLLNNFPTLFSSTQFLTDVQAEFADTINGAYSCDVANNLVADGLACGAEQICVVRDGSATCLDKTDCSIENTGLFGLFSDKASCESADNYCFYDRSGSTTDACFSCDVGMSCYDYKSEDACGNDPCQVRNCQWKSTSSELGLGVCISQIENNCEWCDKPGTEGMQNAGAFNSVFDTCTQQKADLLSTDEFQCVFTGSGAKTCEDVICLDVAPSDCPTGSVSLDDDNQLDSRGGKCGTDACALFNGVCKKDADGDGVADCEDELCELDLYPPNATINPLLDGGLLDTLRIEIFDKTSPQGSYIYRSSGNYTTYLCLAPCSESHPYTTSTDALSIIYSNQKLYDAESGDLLLELARGQNTIDYYVQDPAKNLGTVQSVSIIAHNGTDGPKLLSLTIPNSNLVLDTAYTPSLSSLTIEFIEPATIIFAQLRNLETGETFNATYPDDLRKTSTITFSNLPDGRYVLEISAQNQDGLYMAQPVSQLIEVDSQPPNLVSFEPTSDQVLITTPVTISFELNKKAELISVSDGEENFASQFSTTDDRRFTASLRPNDGNKRIAITSRSFAGVEGTVTGEFTLNAQPLLIEIEQPSYGVAAESQFDLIIKTDNDATCRYDFTLDVPYENMFRLSGEGTTQHRANDFQSTLTPSTSQDIAVRCTDELTGEEGSRIFTLSMDDTPPEILASFAFPNPIVEQPAQTTFEIQSDDQVICKFASNSADFDNMIPFDSFETETFGRVASHTLNISRSATYSIQCMNKAELKSSKITIPVTIDIGADMTVTSRTPEAFNSSGPFIAVLTNKQTICKYREVPFTDHNLEGSLFETSNGYAHTQKLSSLPNGNNTFFITCKDEQQWTDELKITFIIDSTPPILNSVNDDSTLPEDPQIAWQTDRLRVKWEAIEDFSRIAKTIYTLKEFDTGNVIAKNLQSLVNNEYVRVDKDERGLPLNLTNGKTYFFEAITQNSVGLFSSVKQSDGVTIDSTRKPGACSNGELDDGESDIDCGENCDLCTEGKACNTNNDCASKFCKDNVCQPPTCTDNIANGEETGVDCGGPTCNTCPEGSACLVNSDCQTNFCGFGTCKIPGPCEDGKLGPGESDIDCGGTCEARCGLDKNCASDFDCAAGLSCHQQACSQCAQDDANCDGIPDSSDYETIPTSWLIENGLDHTDPNVAFEDADGDGLNNLQEYKEGTDPNSADSDGDGYTDLEEVEAGTDPNDPNSKPSSKWWLWLLIILLILLILGGAGYGGYYYYQKRKDEFDLPLSLSKNKPQPKQAAPAPHPRPFMPPAFRLPPKPQMPPPKKENPKIKRLLAKKDEKDKKDRLKLFSAFGIKRKEAKQEPKPAPKPPVDTKVTVSPAKKQKTVIRIRYTEEEEKTPERKKGDVFEQLKEMSNKQQAVKTKRNQDVLQQLKKIAKKPKVKVQQPKSKQSKPQPANLPPLQKAKQKQQQKSTPKSTSSQKTQSQNKSK